MNIQDALKETGKARKNVDTDNYAQLDISDRLYWHGIKDNVKNSPVQMESILADNWQPYHPKEQIVPKEAGELWVNKHGEYVHTYESVNVVGLLFMQDGWDSPGRVSEALSIIHNQNGWKRLCPEVPNENEIVIEGVKWGINERDHTAFPYQSSSGFEWKDLLNKAPMTMKLIPEEGA